MREWVPVWIKDAFKEGLLDWKHYFNLTDDVFHFEFAVSDERGVKLKEGKFPLRFVVSFTEGDVSPDDGHPPFPIEIPAVKRMAFQLALTTYLSPLIPALTYPQWDDLYNAVVSRATWLILEEGAP